MLKSPMPAESGNIYLNRITTRCAEAATRLIEVATTLEDRDAVTLAELEELRHQVGSAARSLQVVEMISRHFEADLLVPPGADDDEAAHDAARAEEDFRAVVASALAGEVRA